MVWSRREEMRELKELWGAFGISQDGGENWELVPDLQDHVITSVVLDPTSPVGSRTLYAASFAKGVYKSTDNGRTWAKKSVGIEGERPFVWKLAARGGRRAVSAGASAAWRLAKTPSAPPYDGAIYRSTDGAETWVKLSLPEGVNGPVGIAVRSRRRAAHLLRPPGAGITNSTTSTAACSSPPMAGRVGVACFRRCSMRTGSR